MYSIRFKITAITIFAIITTVVFVFAVSFLTIRSENDRESVEMLNQVTESTRKSIEKYTESIEQSVEMAANIAYDKVDGRVMVDSGIVGDKNKKTQRTEKQIEKLDNYLVKYCMSIQEPFATVASHANGVESYFFCINPVISKNVHGFFYVRAGTAGFRENEPINAGDLDPDDADHNIWWYETVRRGFSS